MNVAIFVPHSGCPHQCSFCNQSIISGQNYEPSSEEVKETIETALSHMGNESGNAEIAFFGGSFTAIDREKMLSYLKTAYKYVKPGYFRGIRVSTRPDSIDCDILDILKEHGVTSIELGAQSMDDNVLILNRRGHTSRDVENASALIKEYGFSLGLQMMTGLYGDSDALSLVTAKKLIELKPDTIRIYPTLVLRGTYLHNLYTNGKYMPESLDEAVGLCVQLKEMFIGAGIRVIRVGLHAGNSLERDLITGPYHPAFGELTESRCMYEKAIEMLSKKPGRVIAVNGRDLSKMLGQKKENLEKLKAAGYDVSVVRDNNVGINDIELRNERR